MNDQGGRNGVRSKLLTFIRTAELIRGPSVPSPLWVSLRIGVPRTLSAETIALPVIPNTYPRAHTAARSSRESVAAL